MSTIYDLNVVTPPSLFFKKNGPAILLIGGGNKWKHKVVDYFKYNWVNSEVTIFYADENNVENLIWLYHQAEHVDFILANIEKNTSYIDFALIGIWIANKKTFLSIDKSYQDLELLYQQYNLNNIEKNPISHLTAMKSIWQNIKYRIKRKV